MNLQEQIQTLSVDFALNLLAALRGASIDDLTSFAGGGASRRSARQSTADVATTPSAVKKATKKQTRKGGRLARRTDADIAALADQIVSLVQANKGISAEQIRAELGIEKKELASPMAAILSDGRVTKKGEKRATRYFAKK